MIIAIKLDSIHFKTGLFEVVDHIRARKQGVVCIRKDNAFQLYHKEPIPSTTSERQFVYGCLIGGVEEESAI